MSIASDQIARLDAAAAWERDCWRFQVGDHTDEAEAEREAAAERAAIVAEGSGGAVGIRGLVSVPTTHTDAPTYRAREAARALRARLRCPESVASKQRVARLRCKVGMAARAMQAGSKRNGFRPDYCAMLTLTYARVDAWRPEHLTRFVTTLRNWMHRQGVTLRYVWVAEVQARDAIHYHFALWLPEGFTIPKVDLPLGEVRQSGSCRAAGKALQAEGPFMRTVDRPWWPHGFSRIEAARDAVGYLMNYLQKDKFRDAERLPDGARMHGAGGLEVVYRRARRWVTLPGFVRARSDVFDAWLPATGGGWWSPDGHCIPSEYERAWTGDRYGCVRVLDHGRPFEAHGPFTWLHRREELA